MSAKQGCGEAIGHHGEILQGVFEDDEGQLRRGLASLPCRHLTSKAKFVVDDAEGVSVVPKHCAKAKRAAELALHRFSNREIGGHLTIESNIPVGRGLGSSTADVLATIFAVLESLQIQPPADYVMQIAVNAETACDSTLFSQQAVLFAQREGLVIESFRNPLPPIDFISIDTTIDQTVGTLEMEPALYCSTEIELFRPMRALLRRAINESNLNFLGRVATASAHINQRFLQKPRLSEIEAIGILYDAIGIQVAHSGTVVGLMFDPAQERTEENMERAIGKLKRLGFEGSIIEH
ncbi:GHMP kinase [Paraburkholderia sp. BL9I2N2]|uniref:GHMP family kinase ATP-binding protein n=1 Tax=Paraburkholderia sp. BL9I2N2 TaxID=1938809 RepID=UPI001042D015|nr:GHMP kinase [Paraburkholderia sp. BL9I2N2]TCK94632.1 threonine kinase [Paraburkholderia sp. BL9I2N2]